MMSNHFGEATFENWESEFLQMAFYVLSDGIPLPAGIIGIEAA